MLQDLATTNILWVYHDKISYDPLCLGLTLSSLGLNPNPAINCHPGVSPAGWFINVCAIPWIYVELGVPSSGISWWMLKIPRCPLRRVGELSPAPWYKLQIPARTDRIPIGHIRGLLSAYPSILDWITPQVIPDRWCMKNLCFGVSFQA